jgi:tRNA(Arg) A34 adenosine deaminase TadA
LIIDVPDWVDAMAGSGQSYPTDEAKMSLVIRLARENVDRHAGGPFAAAVFELETGRMVAAGVNSVVRLQSSVVHAEVLAIMLAQQRVGSFSLRAPGLPAHELVASCEPCAMCLGAALGSGVNRLVTGAIRDEALALGFDEGPVFAESYAYLAARGITVVREVMRDDAAKVLDAYRQGGGVIYQPDAGTPAVPEGKPPAPESPWRAR